MDKIDKNSKISESMIASFAKLSKEERNARVANARKIGAEKNAKTYYLQDPLGNQITVVNLKQFCEKNGLDTSNMRKVLSGKLNEHKQWKKGKENNRYSEETNLKRSVDQLGVSRGPQSKEHKDKISKAQEGRVFSEEHLEKLKAAQQARRAKEKT